MSTKPYFICYPGTFDDNHLTGEKHWSPQLLELMGLPENTVVDFDALFARLHPGDRRRVIATLARRLLPGAPERCTMEHRIVRPDGSVRWVYVAMLTVFRPQESGGYPLCTVGTVTDITAQKRAEVSEEAQCH